MPSPYPIVVGHEIVGRAVRVGKDVESGIKVGDRVGVGMWSTTHCHSVLVMSLTVFKGAQSGSCLKGDCEACTHDLEQHCPEMVQTYCSNWPTGDQSRGGFAKYWRGSGEYVLPIPEALPSEAAAPMLCGAHDVLLPWACCH